jgi:hypothetical protein
LTPSEGAKMNIENLSSIISPASLTRAGVPTASVALLPKDRVSTHLITTGTLLASQRQGEQYGV